MSVARDELVRLADHKGEGILRNLLYRVRLFFTYFYLFSHKRTHKAASRLDVSVHLLVKGRLTSFYYSSYIFPLGRPFKLRSSLTLRTCSRGSDAMKADDGRTRSPEGLESIKVRKIRPILCGS